jgi:DNA polymerase-4
MSKIIMHIDLNAFFATAEELRDPSLVGKPLIVGQSGRRGVVSTASYAARKYGIHSAMPTYQAVQLCPNVIIKPVDFDYYEMLSVSFFAYIRTFSRIIEVASIDECFVDMSEALKDVQDPRQYFLDLQNGLLKQIGLKCSIGVAPTKFLAKMASDMKKPMGLTFVHKRDIPSLIYPLPIESFYGIGKRTSPALKEMGINTIGDLALRIKKSDPALVSMFGKFYNEVKLCVEGQSSDFVDPTPFDPKSIGHSETFINDTNDFEEIRSRIEELSSEVASGAKRDGKMGKTVQLVVKDTSFHTHDKSVSFRDPINEKGDIYTKALALYEANFMGMMIRLVGVTLQNLIDPNNSDIQMSLWNYENYEEMDKTKLLVNNLNRKLKKPMLILGSEVKKKQK